MEPTKINVTDLRLRTHEIMEQVKYHGVKYLIHTFGRPTAIILSVDEYQKILAQRYGRGAPEIEPPVESIVARR